MVRKELYLLWPSEPLRAAAWPRMWAGREAAAVHAREVSLAEARARARPGYLSLPTPPEWLQPTEVWKKLATWSASEYIAWRGWWRHLMWSLPIPDWWLPEREYVPLKHEDERPMRPYQLRRQLMRMADLRDEYDYEQAKIAKLRSERDFRRKHNNKWEIAQAIQKLRPLIDEPREKLKALRPLTHPGVRDVVGKPSPIWNEAHSTLHYWDSNPIRWEMPIPMPEPQEDEFDEYYEKDRVEFIEVVIPRWQAQGLLGPDEPKEALLLAYQFREWRRLRQDKRRRYWAEEIAENPDAEIWEQPGLAPDIHLLPEAKPKPRGPGMGPPGDDEQFDDEEVPDDNQFEMAVPEPEDAYGDAEQGGYGEGEENDGGVRGGDGKLRGGASGGGEEEMKKKLAAAQREEESAGAAESSLPSAKPAASSAEEHGRALLSSNEEENDKHEEANELEEEKDAVNVEKKQPRTGAEDDEEHPRANTEEEDADIELEEGEEEHEDGDTDKKSYDRNELKRSLPHYIPGRLSEYSRDGGGEPEDPEDLGYDVIAASDLKKLRDAEAAINAQPPTIERLFLERGGSAYNSIVSRHQAVLWLARERKEWAKYQLEHKRETLDEEHIKMYEEEAQEDTKAPSVDPREAVIARTTAVKAQLYMLREDPIVATQEQFARMTEEAHGLRVVREGESLIEQWKVSEKRRRKALGILSTETMEKHDKADEERKQKKNAKRHANLGDDGLPRLKKSSMKKLHNYDWQKQRPKSVRGQGENGIPPPIILKKPPAAGPGIPVNPLQARRGVRTRHKVLAEQDFMLTLRAIEWKRQVHNMPIDMIAFVEQGPDVAHAIYGGDEELAAWRKKMEQRIEEWAEEEDRPLEYNRRDSEDEDTDDLIDSGSDNDPLVHENFEPKVLSLPFAHFITDMATIITEWHPMRLFFFGGIVIVFGGEMLARSVQMGYNMWFWQPPPERLMY